MLCFFFFLWWLVHFLANQKIQGSIPYWDFFKELNAPGFIQSHEIGKWVIFWQSKDSRDRCWPPYLIVLWLRSMKELTLHNTMACKKPWDIIFFYQSLISHCRMLGMQFYHIREFMITESSFTFIISINLVQECLVYQFCECFKWHIQAHTQIRGQLNFSVCSKFSWHGPFSMHITLSFLSPWNYQQDIFFAADVVKTLKH